MSYYEQQQLKSTLYALTHECHHSQSTEWEKTSEPEKDTCKGSSLRPVKVLFYHDSQSEGYQSTWLNVSKMNNIIVILFVAIAVVCAHVGRFGPEFPGPHGPRAPGPRGPPGPPYLRYVNHYARREYQDIMMNRKLTFAEKKAKIDEWATKYNVKNNVDEFNAEMTKKKEEAEQKVTELIGKLADAQKKVSELFKKKDQTFEQLSKALKDLVKEDPEVYKVLRFAFHQFMKVPGGPGGPGGPWGPVGPVTIKYGDRTNFKFAGVD
ncbi:unnamed protein product [Cylicocyclus nassatus]|uniref:SXP/RAL-2 family protein Ani s 5-like cation-binding domain-containing protein n=1 Tax=Cylicocyclus nassatus TaxID=53992 RepID=A0AA36H1K1_CYLNA|nr:unnamed protein product [Cylicocyclus nassatus]